MFDFGLARISIDSLVGLITIALDREGIHATLKGDRWIVIWNAAGRMVGAIDLNSEEYLGRDNALKAVNGMQW